MNIEINSVKDKEKLSIPVELKRIESEKKDSPFKKKSKESPIKNLNPVNVETPKIDIPISKEKEIEKEIGKPRVLGHFNVENPAYLTLEKPPDSDRYSLIITSIGAPKSKNKVSLVQDIGNFINKIDDVKVEKLRDGLVWPNDANFVPKDIFNHNGIIVGCGFLVPGFSTGSLTLLDTDTNSLRKLTKDSSGWFYHRAQFMDVNNNGKMDIITAKGKWPLASMILSKSARNLSSILTKLNIPVDPALQNVGRGYGELIWLENPGNSTDEWKEHKIADGPDFLFNIIELDNKGTKGIISTGFFSKKLQLSWLEENTWKSRTIDDECGPLFDSQLFDLNNDGKKELLVTNHQRDLGSVFAYEIPDDFKNGEWKKHTLVDDIKTINPARGNASPGNAVAFHPIIGMNGKPHIAVSGDGSEHLHILVPKSDDSNNWNYKHEKVLNVGCMVGKLAVADIDGDGYSEILVPGWEEGKVHVLTYQPQSPHK